MYLTANNPCHVKCQLKLQEFGFMVDISPLNCHLVPEAHKDVMGTYRLSLSLHFQTSWGLTMKHFISWLLSFLQLFALFGPLRSLLHILSPACVFHLSFLCLFLPLFLTFCSCYFLSPCVIAAPLLEVQLTIACFSLFFLLHHHPHIAFFGSKTRAISYNIPRGLCCTQNTQE